MATLASMVFGQQMAIGGLAAFQTLASGIGLVITALLIWTYFKTKDASFWKSKTAQAIYLMAIAIALAPIQIEAYTNVLGPFAGAMAAILNILLVVAGSVGINPVMLSGAVVLSAEIVDDFLTYIKEGTLGTKYPKLD